MSHSKNTLKYIVIAVVLLCIGGAGFGGFYLVKERQEEAASIRADKIAHEQEFTKRFERLLNEFLKETALNASDYKAQRKVMSELVKPENLSTPDYVQENYTLAQNLLPDLHLKIAQIMSGFDQMDDDVDLLLKERSAEQAAFLSAKWTDVKQQHLSAYMQFFTFEQEVLDAYEELMAIYYDTQGRFSVDPDSAEIVFQNRQDELSVWAKRNKLEALQQAQANMIKRLQETDEGVADAQREDTAGADIQADVEAGIETDVEDDIEADIETEIEFGFGTDGAGHVEILGVPENSELGQSLLELKQ